MRTQIVFRTMIVTIVALSAGLAVAADVLLTSADENRSTTTIPFNSEEPVAIKLVSDDVEWQGQTFNLLGLSEVTFNLSERNRLRGSLIGGSTTFDDVTYTIHAAVFDVDGQLLGTASTEYQVQRVWIGVLAQMQAELELDFGISKRYADAATVMLTISSMDVLTPDQWQEQ